MKPKPPAPAFTFYSREKRAQLFQENPNQRYEDVMRTIRRSWAILKKCIQNVT